VTQAGKSSSQTASMSCMVCARAVASTFAQSTPEGRLKVMLISAVGTGTSLLCGHVWGLGEGLGSGEGEGEGEASSAAGGGGE
jgi:hypothetical protein